MTYAASPIKRSRRTKAEMQTIEDAILRLLRDDAPMTVRQVFYRLVSEGVIEKSENEYGSTVVRLLANLRKSGRIPFSSIADNTRWQRKPQTHAGLDQFLSDAAASYRRALWHEQPVYVEVWLEKEALSGVLVEATAEWDVPLMVTRGYPSISFVNAAAEQIAAQRKPAYIYYFGDHDPSGEDIARNVEESLRRWSNDAEIYFEKVAVTEEQIRRYSLPTRPTKKSDSRSRHFDGRSVEVDAIPPSHLRQLTHNCIVKHIDSQAYEATIVAEQEERAALERIARLKGMAP